MVLHENTSIYGKPFDSEKSRRQLCIRSYFEGQGREAELKNAQGDETDKTVNDIMKSITNVRNDRAKKEQAQKWSKMPSETKTKVITKWEEKAKTG